MENSTPNRATGIAANLRAAPPLALTIAGFDPSCGAGVTADLKVFAAHEIYGMAAITALTVQSTQGVRRSEAVEARLLSETLECLANDVCFAGIKIGMLGSGAAVEAVTAFLRALGAAGQGPIVVLDPVLRSSSGMDLLDPGGIKIMKRNLLRQVGWITPNLDELNALTGTTQDWKSATEDGAHHLQQLGAQAGNPALNVVVTGGDLARPDDYLLTAAGDEYWLRGEHVETKATHGTGCAFSTALLCALIAGRSPYDAVAQAKTYVASALQNSYPFGQGKGPMHHLFKVNTK